MLCLSLFVALAAALPAAAAPPDPVDQGNGEKWRQLYETTGLSWSEVAHICPRDGATPCSGSIGSRVLTGWIWATDAQVIELLGNYEPAILTANPPSVSGPADFALAAGFLAEMRFTGYVSTYGGYSEWTGGWTASTDAAGLPIAATVGYGWWPPAGSFSLTGVAAGADQYRGVWLWRPAGDDLTPPAITSTLGGTTGNGGWYVSDVSVSWNVSDAESAISSRVGCDPTSVTSDTTGTTASCSATSAGGTSTTSVVVRRDTTAPTVTCPSPAPAFQLYQVGAWVSASVADTTSGPASPLTQGATNTSTPGTFSTTVSGADRAGNRATAQCSYRVVIPTCNGLAPTLVGTAGNDVVNGTSGRDVIVGLGGADTLNGGGGNDVICGNNGPDTLDGGAGNDFLDGGASNDSLHGGNGTDTCVSGEARLSSCEL
jgi:hypothetical protein